MLSESGKEEKKKKLFFFCLFFLNFPFGTWLLSARNYFHSPESIQNLLINSLCFRAKKETKNSKKETKNSPHKKPIKMLFFLST